MFIFHVNFCVFQFRKLVLSMPDAPHSETLVAGLGSVLTILQPETKSVCRLLLLLLYFANIIAPLLGPSSDQPPRGRHIVVSRYNV